MFTPLRSLPVFVATAFLLITCSVSFAKDRPASIVVDTADARITINPETGATRSAPIKHPEGVISPDGKRIAYIQIFKADGKTFYELCVADLSANGATINEKQLTSGAGNPMTPQWMPDNQTVVYVRGEGKFQQLYSTNVDAEERSERRASAGGVRSWMPRIAPDGTLAYIVERGRDGKATLVDLMIVSGGKHNPIAKNVSITEMAFSPDSQKIAYSNYSELVIVTLADKTTDVRPYTQIEERLYAYHATALAWRPDGTAIAALLHFSSGRASGLGGPGAGEPQPMFGEREAFFIPLTDAEKSKVFSLKSRPVRVSWTSN
jgi:Tol biopolymer transport system component